MVPLKPHARLFEQHRPLMYGVAYRMLGSMSDAEDIVQDAWFRWRDIPIDEIASPRAWLATTVSRLCIDKQRRRKVEKLNYTGPWLPEPVVTESDEDPGPERRTTVAENVSIALLFLLEKLTPLERAVFILKECFDFAHAEIAVMLDIKTAHSRQLLRRARDELGDIPDSTWQIPNDETRALMLRFADALAEQDVAALKELLTDDVVAYSDGGGRVRAALIPLAGFDKVTTVFLHLARRGKIARHGRWRLVNGAWGLVTRDDNGVYSVTTAEIRDSRIARIYTIRNPVKLAYVVDRHLDTSKLSPLWVEKLLAPIQP